MVGVHLRPRSTRHLNLNLSELYNLKAPRYSNPTRPMIKVSIQRKFRRRYANLGPAKNAYRTGSIFKHAVQGVFADLRTSPDESLP